MKIDGLNKELFFLIGLPRSGNTLFGSLMNQNPDIGVTANSITLEIIKDVLSLKQTDVFQNYPDHKSLDSVLDNIYKNYYQNWSYKYIIERGSLYTPGNQKLIENHLKQPMKCIVLCRDLMDVLASYIKWFENEPSAFPNKYGKRNIEEKLWMLMNNKGAIAKSLMSIENALRPENRSKCHFLRYDDLVTNPENEIKKIYSFLEIPYVNHNYKSLNQFNVNGISYDDNIVGNKMHTIRKEIKKEDNPYRSMIPESIRKAYGHIVL